MMVSKLIDLINPADFNRTSEETFLLSNKIKSIIVDTKIENPQEKICFELIKSDSQNALILNALAKSIISEWEDIESR